MPDSVDLIEWDRIAALIEECRAEREACASVRDQFKRSDVLDRATLVVIRDRLLAGAGETLVMALPDDPAT